MGILNGPSSFEERIYTMDIISFLEPEDLVNFFNIDDNYLSSLFNNQEKDLIDVMEKGMEQQIHRP